jgi:cytochrome P450
VARLSSSSQYGGITLFEPPEGSDPAQRSEERASFISLDPPRHDDQRRVAAPMFSTPSLAELEPVIRSRAATILDELPIGEEFDFVDRVSVELTSQMLATLFDFPFEQRRLLPRFSDYLLSPRAEAAESQRQQTEMFMTLQMFVPLWNARQGGDRRNDLISLLANDPATDGGGNPQNYLSNIILLIVAGSDTTRHSITGALLALDQHPGEYARLRANPALLESAVPEFIRWQCPVAYMRRTALADLEIGGKTIAKGDKVAMWYVSGNRDESAIPQANRFIIDRKRPRAHAAFGFGIHRCLGQRLAEMQLRVVWEEMLARFPVIEVTGEPTRLNSNFVKGYSRLPVRIPG